MRALLAAATASVALVGLAGTASAGALAQFTTPTKNIGCIASEVGGVQVLRCDIRTFSFVAPKRPANCPLDYGDSFTLKETGPARWTCHGDTALPPTSGKGFATVRYGRTWKSDAFTCTSRVTALECRNDSGHGFRLSKLKAVRFQVEADAAQRVGILG